MSETLATVLKIAVAAVLIVALIAAGNWAIKRMTGGAAAVSGEDGGEFTAPD